MYLPFIRAINLVSGNTIFCLGYSHFGVNWPYFLGKIFQLLQPHFDIIIEQCIKLLYNFHFNIWFDEIFEHNAIQHHRAPGWIFSMLFVLFFSLMITDDAFFGSLKNVASKPLSRNPYCLSSWPVLLNIVIV